MFTKNIVLSLTIASIITGTALTPVEAMKRGPDDDDDKKSFFQKVSDKLCSYSKKQKTVDTPAAMVTMPEFFKNLPLELNNYIGQFIESVPQNLDLNNPEHRRIVRTILKSRSINKHFRDTFVPLCLRNIRSIKISNDIIRNQQKFTGLLRFLSLFHSEKIGFYDISLSTIDLSSTNITDEQLVALLNSVSRNTITHLILSRCRNLQNPTLGNLPKLINLDLTWTLITDVALTNILNQGNFRNTLQTLILSCCRNLQNPTLGTLPALINLDLSNTPITDATLTNILNQGNFRNTLQTLILSCCRNLQNPTLGTLSALINLDLTWTHITDATLTNILNQGNFRNTLQTLILSSCDNLQNPALGNLPKLINLDLLVCQNLTQVTLPITAQHLNLELQCPDIHFVYVNN